MPKKEVDVFVNAGDSIGFGPYPNEVIEILAKKTCQAYWEIMTLKLLRAKLKKKAKRTSH